MTFQTLLATLTASGIQLRGVGEEIVVTGNETALDAELVRELRAHKATLRDFVREHGGWWAPRLITPEMLPLVTLTQAEIDGIVAGVEGGAANVQDVYPLAPLQEGILFHHLLAREGDPYLVSSLYGFERREQLDAYVNALQAVIGRHDILRTAVAWEGLPEPVQVVWRRARLAVEEVEPDAAAGDAARALWDRFDPRRTRLDLRRAPLMRAAMAHDAAEDRWLLLVQEHHLIGDHTTLEVLREEIQVHLQGREAELPAPLPFRTFVAQARRSASRPQHEAFFRALLGGVEEPTAPFGLLDVWSDGSGIEVRRQRVEPELEARLRSRARALGVSAASVCHVAWGQVLARVTGRDDVVFGTVLFGRMQGGEGADRVLGLFMNTLPVRVRVDTQGAESAVREMHRQLAELLRHEHASLGLAQRGSGVEAPAPLFTSILNYRHSPGAKQARVADAGAAEGGMRQLRGETRTNYPVELSVDDMGEGLGLTAHVPASVGAARVCALMHQALETLAEALERAPDRAVGMLDVLPEAERRLVVEAWNRTEADFPRGACLHELFEAQVERTPGAVAVVSGDGSLTYAELNARANRLAHHLRALGVGPEARVGICVERGLEMMVGLLAVLKAGGAYLPLDPGYPTERRRYMLADSRPAVLLTRASIVAADEGLIEGLDLLVLDFDAPAWRKQPATNPARGALRADHLAYVIYTSGSTGAPKGVMVAHGGVVNLVHWYTREFEISPRDSVLIATSYAFDLTQRNLFGPLLSGGQLHLAREPFDPRAILAQLRKHGITLANLTSTAFHALIDAGAGGELAGMRLVVLGGEATRPEKLMELAPPRPAFVNAYGPTECSGVVTYHRLADDLSSYAGRSVPLGEPIANSRIYILDGAGEPAPVGVVGELYVGGVQVARGYLNRPELTAERFVADAFSGEPGARLYRTGDLGRWRQDGAIEFAGRNDFQVKVRGFRVELGEIEARLREHAAVREAVVVAREERPGDQRLVAYWVGEEEVGAEALRRHVGERLPEYMVPAAYIHLEALPLTPSAKLDRRALPSPEGDAYARRGYEAPSGDTEEALAKIWSEVLGVERVSRWDHFFELGGHSLLAVQMVSRLRQALGVELPLGAVFEHPVFATLVDKLLNLAQTASPEPAPPALSPIERVERSGRLPLSYAQQRLWFLEQMGGLGSTYHIPGSLQLRGELDREALVRALDRLVERHEALRTTFSVQSGEPEQRIGPETSRFALMEHDLVGEGREALERLVAEEATAPFDLERGPLIRGRLIRLAEDDHLLLVTMHHIVSDAWSIRVLTDELGRLYAAFREGRPDPLPPLPIQYADYAAWQRRWVEGEVLEAQASYWTKTLAGAPALLELPTDHPRPQLQDHAGASVSRVLDEPLAAALKALSRRHGTTLFMTLLAGWAVVLGRLSGQEEVVIGTPTANRGRREIEGLIGFFVNTLALRVDFSERPTVAEVLERLKTRVLEAQQNQDIPFEQVVERVNPVRTLAYTPLFQVMFDWQNAPRGGMELPGLELGRATGAEPGRVPGAERTTAKFDLTLSLGESGGRIGGSLTYATSLFERATVERHLAYLRRVLEAIVADDRKAVDALPLLPEAERRLVVEEWNATDVAYPRELCIHALFEAQAGRSPEAVAVVHEDRSLTYAELNALANRLAHHLRERGVGPYARVAVCAGRGLEMVVGLLAVLKAGGAYVPLDPSYPAERLRYLLHDSAPAAVLAQRSLDGVEALFAGVDLPVIDLEGAEWARCPETDPGRAGLAPGHPAYVMYTSGSTGEPKGVVVPHRAIARLVVNNGYADFGADDRVAFAANPAFDASTLEVWAPLLNGGRIVVIAQDVLLDSRRFAEALNRHGVDVLWMTVGLFNQYADELENELSRLRYLIVGGDALDPRAIARVLRSNPPKHLLNGYGPTETTTFAITHEIVDVAEGARGIPLGRPISNTQVYILDRAGHPVPVGVAGEMYIGGAGVALGYLNRPALTAQRFVADPFSARAGARLYRTGDLGRWRADGTIEFLGRNDFQVKIRGFRIEPGEIEARLAEYPEVREAVVLVREDTPGEKRLVAYVVAEETVGADVLRAHLSDRLPEYMVPAAYVRLDALPLTPNGKLDRKALPAPEADAYAAREYEPPVGETESAVAEIWAEVLRVDGVGRHDDFFELGGHSLLAVQVISRVRQVLEVEVALGEVFTRPVLSDFARTLETATRSELPPIEPASREGRVPLSFAQQRLWFLEQWGDLGSTYHISTRQRLRGGVDRAALVRALDRIVARHEALRTTFAEVDGVPEQRIAPADAGFRLVEDDLGGQADAQVELGRLLAEEAHARFDLERGPLIRGRLIRLAADDHVLLLTMHHIVSDGWSMGVLTRELSALYGAFRREEPDPLPRLPVQYADYAAWQRKWVDGEVLQQQAEYWKAALSGAPELLELPTDRPRPARQDHAGAAVGIGLGDALSAGLKALSRRHGTTLFMTLLAGWAAVLGRLSGQEDVVVGTPSANRGRREIEGLIGFFVNTLALRIEFGGSPSVSGLLGRVRERALGAQQNQDIPFEQVVELVHPARSMAHAPLFQVMFTWQNAAEGRLKLPGLSLAPADAAAHVTAKFDLLLSLSEDDGRIVGEVEYATALFDRATVKRWLGYLRRMLEGMAADDGLGIDRLPMLAETERRLVLREWNATDAAYPREACVHELVEAQVERTPGAVAVVFEGERVTYAELNARANRLGHHLRALGVGTDARVGICVERSVEMVVGLLGILKAGGAYVPLDASYPVERLRHMLEDSAPAVLLTHPPQAATAAALSAGSAVPVLDLTRDEGWADQPETNPGRDGVGAENLVHVLFTSGSTGRPKGVMLEHGSLVNRLAWMQDRYGMEPGEALLQKTPFSFDVSFWEFFWPLMVGARLVMARPDGHRDPAYLAATIRREGITTAHFVPSMLQLFLEHPEAGRCTGLLRVPVSGEAVSAALVRQFHQRLPGVGLYNQYGPTESGEVTEWACDPDAERVSIGRAIHNSAVYALDRAGEPVPVGVAGELFIGGVAVARGYLGRPGLTAERFVPHPFGEPGARLYRTGDLCRWLLDGTLEYLGRTDFQVKVRGFRVELGEIEARLAAHPGVREAVALALDDGAGGKRLVAYFVGEALESEALRAHLSQQLPEYMVPTAFVRLDAFPVTPNGKLDRRALPAPDADAFAARDYEAPVGETEQALAEIWSELLGVERVGRGDHFFALGGHSLLAVRVVSRVRQALGVEAEIRDLFVRPVLADFARGLETAARAEAPAITPVDRTAPIPLSFAQQRLWFLEQLGDLGSTYHIPSRLRLKGELDRDALAGALNRIVARHEALRTTFAEVDGVPEQRIAPAEASGFHLVEHDLSGQADAEAELDRWMNAEARAPFDLERGPLVRGRLIQLAADDHVLLITMHHIVSDGWSMGVLRGELSALYAAFRDGEPDPLPELPVQYADYAAWQRGWVEGELLERQARHWERALAGAPELLELPTDRARPRKQDFAGDSVDVELGEELTAALKALSQRHGATLFMTLLAGWATVLARLSGQDDVVVGTPSANRGRREIEELIGFFVNTLALRVDLSGAATVVEVLARVKARALEAQQNQDIPFEQVVERVQPARSLAHTPLFQVMFAWQNASEGRLELPGLRLGGVRDVGATFPVVPAKFDLSLTLGEAGGRIGGSVTYATALFEQATVERHLAYLRRVLEAMVADDLQAVDALPLLPEAERRRVVEEWSATEAAHPSELCIHELFEAQVRLTPEAVALVHADEALTYAALDARANRLAHYLRRLGVSPEARVGVFLEWGPELVVSLLAVLKAGGVYVPLDPALPDERLAYMAEDAGAGVVVTRAALAGRLGVGVTVRVDADAERIAAERGEAPASGVAPESLAYLIYTSGSTGRPKGVAVEHRAAAAHFPAMARTLEIAPEDRVLQFASSGFDVSLEQVFLPLLSGAALVLRGAELWSPAEFGRRARSLGVTVANLPPAYWQEVLATGSLPAVRLLLVGGDALPAAAAAGDATRLLNCYGPTEAVVTATAFAVPDGFAEGFAGATAPIGRPLPGRSAYILDARGAPVPLGVAGELYLGGLLARGYLGQPGLTAERFVPDPFGGEPGARLYRTGDLVRWLPDGTIEFLGRTDFQVKVRGFRIELGEIEARLREHAVVREAVVVTRAEGPGDTRLVAYWAGEAEVGAEALRLHLSERLPEYMVPAAYVRLDAFPLTPNGKLDRRALPAPEGDAFATRGYEAPVSETEQALAEIFAEVLGVERVGRHDHFFELGGHSLLAVRVISRVRQVLGAEVGIAGLFDHPVLADLARAIDDAARTGLPPIEPADRLAPLPLSFAQQRLWFLEQLGDLGSTYHIPTRMRLGGELDRAALRRALDTTVARHEALRTTFVEVEGEPVQRIAPVEESCFHLLEHDLSGHPDAAAQLRRLAAEEADAPFDLECGPLIRGRLVRLAEDDHVLLMTMHHIVSDGWSMGVLTRELGTLYDAFRRGEANPLPLPPLPVQYPDYAAWQRRWVDGDVLREQAEYWRRALSGAPALLELPTDHPRPARQDHAGGTVGIHLDQELTAGLKSLGRRHGTTLFMTVLAGWAAVLGRLSGQEDVVVGTPTANRGRTEIEGLIGFFVNTLALRVDLSGSPTVAELLAQVRARALGGQQHQDVPFEQVVELVQPTRSMAHAPLFQVMFSWQNASEGGLELPGLRAGGVGWAGTASHAAAKFDLSLSLGEAGGRIGGSITYATALFERATVERHLAYLRRVLDAMVADDAQAVDRLELLDAAERSLVLEEWNRTEVEVPQDTCVHELFEAQVARTPDVVAVVFEDRSLTYAELNERANRLAHHLRGRGVGPDVRVAVCIERSLELMIAFLAVLKSGGAYVPLDPGDPEERLRHMLDDGAPAALLVHAGTAARFAGEAIPVIDLDADAGDWAGESAANPSPAGVGPALDHLAYVIYTSGSTGRPKGVMVEHRALANVMGWMGEAWPLGPDDVVLQKTPVSFDASARELFPPLLAGARMVIARPGGHRDPAYLVETIRREGVTTLHFVPTMLQFLLEEPGIERCTRIARVVCGGEALPAALARRAAELLPNAELHNVYGPTEAAVDVTWLRCPAEVAGPHVSIGRPMANCCAYFLDAAGGPAPAGVVGELYLGGAQVARGYLGRAALTAERFVPDPFGGEPGARLYRTGDLGRWRETASAEVRECVSALDPGADAGTVASHDSERTPALPHSRTAVIEFLGRNDFQVKVRGFRIELGEIEARLREHEGVREAVVVARENEAGDRRLVAYWVGDAVEIDALRAHLSGRLPEHMVPAAYVRLEALPLTSNGKLDRKALPAPEGDAFATRGYEAPLSEMEQALAEIWSELLGVEQVGRWDHFFELGGHSLLAVRVISRVRQVLGVEVPLGELFRSPVLADLSRVVEDAARTELPPIERVDRGGRLPLSFAQQRLWFLEQMGDLGSTYHIPRRLRLGGDLDRAALRRTLDAMLARHEALRTTFVEVEGEPVQRIAEESRFHLLEHDLGEHPDAAAELRRLGAEEADEPFDLEHGPLIRGRLVRLSEGDHVLLITLHHIVSDGWSAGVLTRELGTLYAAFRRGEANPLPPLPVQYADYAAWQRKWVDGEVLREQAEYWKAALSGVPELLELPTDHPRPARQDHAGATVGIDLGEELTAGLKALGQRRGTTLFMTLLAGWAAVLGRLSGQEDVVIGTPSANRGRAEIEGLIGFFVNTLALRVDFSGSPTVAELLEQVRTRSLGAQQNQDIPFEQVVELVQPTRSMAYAPLFQVMFGWQNASGGRLELPGLRLGGVASASQAAAKFDLSLSLGEAGGRIGGGITYATALFDRATVERHLVYLRRVLEAFVAGDLQAVDALPLLPEAERRLVLEEWNRTDAAVPGESCVHALFEAQVERAPDAEAVVFERDRLTYAELNAAANRLARRLRAAGVGPEARVGVMLERSAELVVALLAVLKAGGAYLPLDLALPAARRAALAADAGAAVLVTREPTLEGFAGMIVSPAEADGEDGDDLGLDVPTAALAYVIYTSGSTGAPKGVGVAHAEAAAHCRAAAAAYGLTPADRVLQFAAMGFDVSVEQMLAPLSAGACVVVRGNEVPTPLELARRAAAQGLTVINPPTAYWHQLAADPDALELLARSVRLVIAGGEAMSPAAARAWAAGPASGVRLLNGYGPTETVVTCTGYDVPAALPDGAVHVPVGRPFGGRTAYVLEGRGEPAPLGVPGELCIGGVLARGYLGRPAATAQAFVPDPFSATPGARMYRTGDRARWLAAGELEFLGRRDHQVKVRGFRIELGEIEARLAEHPEVRESVVLAREDAPGETRLVAYWVGEETAGAEALRAHLGETLPAYMVPAAFVRLGAFPLTPSGKLDRRALPAPDAPAARTYEAPVGETEEALAEIFAEVLGVARVGRRDNFFELGGHSLLAVRVISRVRQVLEAEVVLAHVFSHPTVESLAARLTGADDGHRSDRAIAIRPTGSRPPLFLAYDGTGSTLYAQVLHPHIDAEIPVYALPAPSPSEPPLRTVEGMAARLVRMIREVQPLGPYRLAGWSFGGVLSYEVAAQLIGRDEVVEFVGLFDSGFTAGSPAESRDTRHDHALIFHALRTADTTADGGGAESDEEIAAAGDEDLETFVRKCREEGLLPRHVTVAQARAVRDRLHGHEAAWAEYSPQPIPVLLHQFPAGDSRLTDPTRGWGAFHPEGRLRVTPVPGTHLSMMRAPNAATLGEALSRAVDRACEEAAPRSAAGGSPVVTLQGGAAGAAPLFCVPGAGSGVTSFVDLMSALGPSVPVYGLQPRGLDGETPPHATVQAAAEHYLRALREACPTGPVHLLGHSFGGWVALEMALRLHEAGRPVASLTILDSEVPDDSEAVVREYGGGEAFLKLVEVVQLVAERSLGIGPAEVAARDEAGWLKLLHGKMVELGLLGARATPEVLTGPFRTFARCLRTAYRPSGVYPGRLRLVLVDDPAMDQAANRAQSAEVERGWREWAPGLVFSAGAGNHVTALKLPHVAALAGFLAEDRSARER